MANRFWYFSLFLKLFNFIMTFQVSSLFSVLVRKLVFFLDENFSNELSSMSCLILTCITCANGRSMPQDLKNFMTPQCVRSVVQVMVVRVDIGVVTYEAMTPQCVRSVVQVMVVRVDIGVVTYEAMTPQCVRSVVQVLLVRVDKGVVTYEAMTP